MGIVLSQLIEYEKYVNYRLGLRSNGRKKIIGRFREKGNPKIITEEFECLDCRNDAKLSYGATIKYFNYTRNEFEPERVVVDAKWVKEDEGDE